MRIATFPIVPLVRASHLQPTFAVTAITTALAVSVGRGAGSVWVLLAVLSGQFSVGWSNDFLDRERDLKSNRTDKPIVARQISASLVGTSAVVALGACVPLSLMSGWRAGSIHLIAVASAWLYNVKLKSTLASVVPYLFAFGLLPAFVTLGLGGHPWPRPWAMISAALLGAGAHFINVLPDLETDRATGVFGLPHRLGFMISLILGASLVAASTIVIALSATTSSYRLRESLLALTVVGLIGICAVGLSGRKRTAWPLTMGLAGISAFALIVSGSSLVRG